MSTLKLTKLTRKVYPHADKYVKHLKMTGNNVDLVIDHLNKCSQNGEHWSLEERLCVATLMSIPFTPIAGLLVLLSTSDFSISDCKETQKEYMKFCSNMRE